METEIERHFRAILVEGEDAEKIAAQSAYINPVEVTRAARQLMERYPHEPAATAVEFAEAALILQEFYLVLFWRRVARRIRELHAADS